MLTADERRSIENDARADDSLLSAQPMNNNPTTIFL